MNDSGLRRAMGALLGIIAGLLIADMLQVVVAAWRVVPVYWTTWLGDLAVCVAAAVYLFRVVVDNLLFYELDDRTERAFKRRITLILLDLLSYAVLYHMVTGLNAAVDAESVVSEIDFVIGDIAIVECLHAIWCSLSLRVLDVLESRDADRRELLRRWGVTSGGTACVAVVVAAILRWPSLPYQAGAFILFAFSAGSAMVYARVLRRTYTGDALTWATPRDQVRLRLQSGDTFSPHP